MRRKRKNRGITLIELMVVLIILGLIAGAVAMNVGRFLRQGQKTRIEQDMTTIMNACDLYKMTNGKHPDGIDQLTSGDEPYLKAAPKDPWGYDYVFKKEGSKIVIYCYGDDGAPGGEGEGKDYSSEEIGKTEEE